MHCADLFVIVQMSLLKIETLDRAMLTVSLRLEIHLQYFPLCTNETDVDFSHLVVKKLHCRRCL